MHLLKSQRKIILLNSLYDENKTKHGKIINGHELKYKHKHIYEIIFESDKSNIQNKKFNVGTTKLHMTSTKPNSSSLKNYDKAIKSIFPEANWSVPIDEAGPVSNDLIDVFEFGKNLGYGMDETRYKIDKAFASNLPAFSCVTYKYADALKFVKEFGGLYSYYRLDKNRDIDKNHLFGLITKGSISIRYPIPYKPFDANIDGDSRVRCNLIIPGYHNDGIVYKYDGFVVKKGRYLQWIFQSRKSPNNKQNYEDIILFYTQTIKLKNTNYIKGTMMSQNQSNALTPTVSSILIRKELGFKVDITDKQMRKGRIKDDERLEQYFPMLPVDETDFMASNNNIINPQESSSLSDDDQEAIQLLMEGWKAINTKGLIN